MIISHLLEIGKWCLGDQRFEGVHIAQVVAGFVDRRLSDESGMCERRIVEQTSEGIESDLALADMLMTIKLGAAISFGIIAMPDRHVLYADGFVQLFERVREAGFADNVIAGDVSVAGID